MVDLGGSEIRAERLAICCTADGQPEVIGSGGYGVVYKALYNGSVPVAVKIAPNAAGKRREDKVRVLAHVNGLVVCMPTLIG